MKKIKIKKVSLKIVALIVSSATLIFLLIWLGFSFFSMRSDNPYVGMLINLEDNSLANKVISTLPRKDGKYIEYDFTVIIEEYTKTDNAYEIVGVPYNYQFYYPSRDESRFRLLLDMDKGKYDFTTLEWNDPLIITLKYRVDRDFKYFKDFAWCTAKKAYSNTFNINNPCGRGNCVIKRDLTSWSVELIDKDSAEKISFFESFDYDSLIRGLFNHYITDDYGYFDPKAFKIRTMLTSFPDATHMFSSEIHNQGSVSSQDSSTIQWLLGTTSSIYNKGYDEYEELDLLSYMETVGSYYSSENRQSFFDCQISYNTIENLGKCKSDICNNIKTLSYNYCKEVLDYEMSQYEKLSNDYYGYDMDGSGNAFILYLPSQMLYYNKIVDALGLNVKKYGQNEIYGYYDNSEKLYDKFPTVIGNCQMLKMTEELDLEFKDPQLSSKVPVLYESLPEFSSFCDNITKNNYCLLSLAKKMVCADATSYSYPEISKEILFDIFYRHYFKSPASLKLNVYENYRFDEEFNSNISKLDSLDEYGYFVYRKEIKGDDGVKVVSFVDMLDSYYFIYLLNKINGN